MSQGNNPENDHLCLYRSWAHVVNGESRKAQGCMPGGGLNCLRDSKPGDVAQMGDGTKYQVVKCKFPECL